MRMILLIAAREYVENIKTKGFWIGILLFPLLMLGIIFFQATLADSAPARRYILIDQSGIYDQAVEAAIRQEHQRRILQAFVLYLIEYRRENTGAQLTESNNLVDRFIDQVEADEVSALDQWLANGGLDSALALAAPTLRENAPPFVPPREQFVQTELPPGIDPNATPGQIVEQMRPWLTGQQELPEGDKLFALILIPRDVDDDIIRPGPLSPAPTPPEMMGRGVQYWGANLTDTRLSSAIERSINSTMRSNEFAARGIDRQVVRDIERTRLQVSRLDPARASGDESVSMADTLQQWAPVGFVYLMFISLMQSVQYLLSNTIEEKSNRIIEVLLASVTPLELMMGKLAGIGMSGITTILAWIVSFIAFISLYPGAQTQFLQQALQVMLSSDLVPWFVFYYLAGYALYSGIFLAIGSLCNTLKEAQGLMMPMMMVLMVPLITMTFIARDPNGEVARIMSWIPMFTPFTMMNRAAAQPPMVDVIGTAIVLLLSIVLVLWLCGKIFRQGVLRTGQPPRLLEIVQMLRHRH